MFVISSSITQYTKQTEERGWLTGASCYNQYRMVFPNRANRNEILSSGWNDYGGMKTYIIYCMFFNWKMYV